VEDIIMTISDFVKKHPVLAYFALTFAISWGGILLVIGGPGGIPATPEQFERLLPLAIPAYIGGPSIAGLVLTGLVSGRKGYRALWSRLLKWRVGVRWYAIALLAAPLVFALVHLALSLVSPVYLPGILTTSDRASLLLSGLAGGLIVGIFEELGWTGFAIPQMRLRQGVLATGLIVGALWGAWHLFPEDIWAARVSAGGLSLAVFMTLRGLGFLIGQLLAFRVLMVWVYERTGSLLVAMLMHVSLTACTFIIGPSALTITGVPLLIYDLVLSAAWWVIVAAVAVASRGRLARQQPRRRTA
jgi:membrane protease YdiL (CAAX protease family)